MTTRKELYLSVVDQTIGRRYIQHLHIFPFPDLSFAEKALYSLRVGLSLTVRQLPFLTGTLKVLDSSTGVMRATYPSYIRPDHGDTILTVSNAFATDLDFDYKTMERQGFPVAMLHPCAFCPLGLRNHAGLDDQYAATGAGAAKGYRIPIMCAQATFIPGGLVLGVYTHHTVVDGTALGLIYDIWSGHVRGLNNRIALHVPNAESNRSIDVSSFRLTLNAMAHTTNLKSNPNCSELTTANVKPAVTPLRSGPYNNVARILSLPALHILAMRVELQAQTDVRISTFVTIAALLWVHITRARSDDLLQHGHATTTLGIAMDMRERSEHVLAKDFIGNMALFSATKIPILTIINPEKLADALFPVALAISTTISVSSSDWLTERLRYLSSVADPSTVTPAFTLANGPDLFITSWQRLGADLEWDIPGTNAAKASAIRKPGHVRGDGGMIILPRREGGDRDYEVLIYLEEGEMQCLVESLGDACRGIC